MSDYTLGDTIYHAFTTRAFATGVPTALAGSPTLEIYENDSTSPIVEGASKLVLTQNLNSINGFNLATITATSGNGFEAGKTYHTILKTGTVGGTSVVGEVVFRFTLQASAAAVDLANGTDGLGALKTDTAAILVDTGTTLDGRIPAALTANGNMKCSLMEIIATALTETAGQIAAAFKQFFNIATPAATMDHGILVDTVTTYTGNTKQTSDVATLITTVGVAGVGLSNLGDTRIANLDATVSSRSTYAGGAVASVTAAVTVGTNNDKTGYALSSAGVTAIWAEVIDGTRTAVQAMRGFMAALLGKASGLDLNAPKYRNVADTKNVVDAVTDANGNRTSVTLDLT